MIKRYFLPALAVTPLLALLPALAAAQTPNLPCRPAIVYHTSQDALKEERSINQLAFAGIERVKKELKVAAREYFAPPGADLAGALKQAAGEGATVVVTVGFHAASVLPQVAEGAPQVRFVLIDGMAPPLQNNLTSIMYKDHEGAFLAGLAAAMQSKSHTVGFIGGMDVPIIRNFAYGFLQGAHYAEDNVKVRQTMLGTTDKAWTDSARATAAAERHVANGADVLYPAAGAASTAVLSATQAQKKWAVASDLNQNAAFPGTVL
ncbi:MAG: BMP family ABC transporter substrate-binding protein, partial [Alphaproteobacteria bacterium]|nr:BMP family ABC transporter substrate-binding protein [Alphaproteobacteria bacterium]